MATSQEKALLSLLGKKTGKNWEPRMGSKSQSREYAHAKLKHKERPKYEPRERKMTAHEKAFKSMSIADYENKYKPFGDK